MKRLADSFSAVGQLHPITVYAPDNENVLLVAGLHRVEAAKLLDWSTIDAIIVNVGEADRRLIEITENLHRSDLTALERDEHVAEWIRLTQAKLESDKLVQYEPVSKGGRGNEGGVRAAARDLGIEHADAHRAVKVAGLSDEAKEAARETGLDDNRSALLDAAKHQEPEKQAEAIHDAAKSGTKKTRRKGSSAPRKRKPRAKVNPARAGWEKASLEQRKEFAQEYVDDVVALAS